MWRTGSRACNVHDVQGSPEKHTHFLKACIIHINLYFLFIFRWVIECSYKFHLTPRWTLKSMFLVQERISSLDLTLQQNQLCLSRGSFSANSQGGKSHIATPSKAWYRSSEMLTMWQTTTRPSVVHVKRQNTSTCSGHSDSFGTVTTKVHQTAVTGSGDFQEFCDESQS